MQRKRRYSPAEVDAALVHARALYSARPSAAHDAALVYVGHGWPVVPLPLAGTDQNVGKRPMLKDWQYLRITTAEQVRQHFRNRVVNVGVLLGSVSHLIDVDLDCPEALDLADQNCA
jgi:hypothetical protein